MIEYITEKMVLPVLFKITFGFDWEMDIVFKNWVHARNGNERIS